MPNNSRAGRRKSIIDKYNRKLSELIGTITLSITPNALCMSEATDAHAVMHAHMLTIIVMHPYKTRPS